MVSKTTDYESFFLFNQLYCMEFCGYRGERFNDTYSTDTGQTTVGNFEMIPVNTGESDGEENIQT